MTHLGKGMSRFYWFCLAIHAEACHSSFVVLALSPFILLALVLSILQRTHNLDSSEVERFVVIKNLNVVVGTIWWVDPSSSVSRIFSLSSFGKETNDANIFHRLYFATSDVVQTAHNERINRLKRTEDNDCSTVGTQASL